MSQPISDGIYTNYPGTIELGLVKGEWFLNLGAKKHVEEGIYTFSGNQIAFDVSRRDSEDPCDAGEKSFHYQWGWAGGSITLTPLDDSCDVRTLGLVQGPLLQEGAGQVAPR